MVAKVEVDFSVLSEYFKAAEKCIQGKSITFIQYENNEVSLKTEETLKASLALKFPALKGDGSFSIGVDTEVLTSLWKRLYDGNIELSVSDNKFTVIKDNIKAAFPTTPGKYNITLPEFEYVIKSDVKWFVERLVDCASVPETFKKSLSNKFSGILFDNTDYVSRICKFSDFSMFLSVSDIVLKSGKKYIIPDELSKVVKSFKSSIESISVSDRISGVKLSGGTYISFVNPVNVYPDNYVSFLGLSEGASLVSDMVKFFTFESTEFSNAVEVVSSVIGSMDSWVNFEIMGKLPSDELVWRVSGSSYKGDSISEDVLSSGSGVVEKFSLNKDRLKEAISLFSDSVSIVDLGSSVCFFSQKQRDRAFLLIKARV